MDRRADGNQTNKRASLSNTHLSMISLSNVCRPMSRCAIDGVGYPAEVWGKSNLFESTELNDFRRAGISSWGVGWNQPVRLCGTGYLFNLLHAARKRLSTKVGISRWDCLKRCGTVIGYFFNITERRSPCRCRWSLPMPSHRSWCCFHRVCLRQSRSWCSTRDEAPRFDSRYLRDTHAIVYKALLQILVPTRMISDRHEVEK